MKDKETIEEAAENAFNDFKSKNPIVPQKHILPFKLGYIEGAKWQAKRTYSEEEVINLLNEFSRHLIFNKSSDLTINHWFEQFKKK